MLRLTFLVALFLVSALAVANTKDGDWVSAAKARSPDDISLWTRSIPGAELKDFKGETHFALPMANVVAMIYDLPSWPEWLFRCREVKEIGKAENGDRYFHIQVDGIWPVSDRDAVIRVHGTRDTTTGEVVFTGIAAPNYLMPMPGIVRIPVIESTWTLRPVENNLLRVTWTGHVDPGGRIPHWMSNTLSTLIPRYTLTHLRTLLEQPKWQGQEANDAGNKLLEQVHNIR